MPSLLYLIRTILLILSLLTPLHAWSQTGKPLLSAEIGAAIEAGGAEAAKKRMAEIYPAQKEDYEVDTQGLTALAIRYMQAGNHEAANAVMELLPVLLADMMASTPYGAQMQQMAAREQGEAARESVPVSAAIMPTAKPGPAVIPGDTNRGLVVDNAVVEADGTRLLFHTFPQRGDPNAGGDCPLNFYTTSLLPGLPNATAEPIAIDVCGFAGTHGRLLDNGDLLLEINRR